MQFSHLPIKTTFFCFHWCASRFPSDMCACVCLQQDVATSGFHAEALRAESQRAQTRLEKELHRMEKELSSCQDAKRRLEAELAMSMHGAYASRTNSGANTRNGSSGAAFNFLFLFYHSRAAKQ